MINRVKVLKQIGRFHDFRTGGSLPFANGKKITLLHASNTLGKTTFTQILKSLGDNNSVHISSRRSIPPQSGVQQEAKLSYFDLTGTEKEVSYKSGVWTSSDLKDRIVIFDQDFIHTHVMLGDHITRENKEQFTDFILGEEGVKLSKKIETDKKTLRISKTALSTFRPAFVRAERDEKDVQKFIDMEVDKDTPALQQDRETETKRLLQLERISDFKKMLAPDLVKDSAEQGAKKLTTEHGIILTESYDSISDEAWKTLQEHITNNNLDDSTVAWLKTGTKINKHGDKCPFCSQDMSGVKSLIDAYQTIFDQKFEVFDSTLRTRINKLGTDTRLETAKSFTQPVNDFIDKLKPFLPYIQEIDTDIASLKDQVAILEDADSVYKKQLAIWAQGSSKELDDKLMNTHKPLVSGTDTTGLFVSAKAVSQVQNDISAIQQEALDHIKNAKSKVDKLTPEQITSNKEVQNKKISEINKKLSRIEQDEQCGIYSTKKQDITDLSKIIVDDSERLETEQSDYLVEYFEKLDAWFKKLGSDTGFEIKKESTNKGDKKVYSLAITFHGEKVASEDLGKVCSESDKRNLALAIFLSKAEKLPNKDEYVLVFDDPVVSFDDNRISKTCRQIKILAPDFRQIIVTTHYASLVKHFVEVNMDSAYVAIELESNQSVLKELDPIKFASNAHIRAAEKLLLFVEGSSSDPTRDLRPFMEEHLRIRFQQQIASIDDLENGLANLINALDTAGHIGSSSKANLHAFRETFNPDMHRSGDETNIEEVRADTRELLNLLYGDMSS